MLAEDGIAERSFLSHKYTSCRLRCPRPSSTQPRAQNGLRSAKKNKNKATILPQTRLPGSGCSAHRLFEHSTSKVGLGDAQPNSWHLVLPVLPCLRHGPQLSTSPGSKALVTALLANWKGSFLTGCKPSLQEEAFQQQRTLHRYRNKATFNI